jgi:2,4-dienoyl-CoA reductase (NADPH2)
MANTKFKHLLEPGSIGSIRIKNRMVKMGASIGHIPSPDGSVPQKLLDYYEALARGGAGLVVFAGGPIIFPMTGEPGFGGYRFDHDKFISSLSQVAQVIRKYDCPAFFQVFGGGAMSPPGTIPACASTMSQEEIPVARFSATRELTIGEIEQIVQLFAGVAERVKKAGFQGLELNGGCNHLLNCFLSRFWNRRHDAYGCDSLESRAKIVTDIIKEIKRRNGKDFALISLINGAEPRLPNGITTEESQGLAKIIQSAGADAIHVRVEYYTPFINPDTRDSTHFPDIALFPEIPDPLGAKIDTSRGGKGGWVPLAAAVKKAVSIPVIATGRLDAEMGEKIIGSGLVDFINMNRRLMADHDYPNKVAAGKLDDITPCTGCYTCFDANERRQSIICQVNPALGKERECEIKPAGKKKKVMVVGGGPAGMETARVAALRGHQVILFEKDSQLGGALPIAAIVKGFEREDFLSLVKYLRIQITKLGVDVRLGKEASRSLIEEVRPDVLVIAAGGKHSIPEIPGIYGHNVITSQALHKQLRSYMRFFKPKALRRLTNFWMPVGKNVVIMGGGIHGCEAAELLVRRGRKVTIVETGEKIGDGLLEIMVKPLLLDWFSRKGVTILNGVKYEEITDKGLTVTTREGIRQILLADTVVTALPLLPNTDLGERFEGIASEVYNIGDSKEPRLTMNAIADGARVGRAI